jgi:hypothetical protein
LAVNEEIDLDDLLVETNPTLADQLRFRAEKWQQFQADALSPSQMQISTFDTQLKETTILDLSRNVTPPLDGRAEELLISVMPFHCYGAIYDRLCAKINRWGQLSEEDRTNLTRKVADFVEARRAETFLDEVAERFPTRARMPITLAVLCLGPVMVLLTFLVFWLLPFQPLPILLAVLFGVMLILASFRMALQIRARWQQRAWLQDVLVSEGMKRGIDFRIVLDILRDWDRFQGQVSNQLSEVRESRFLLAEHLSRLLLRFGLDRTARSGKDRQAAT